MTTPFISQIKIFAFPFAPRGWAPCDGRLLPINQYQALFSLIGTYYGGDGRTNFALPDLRGRSPIGAGQQYALGARGGEEKHALTSAELPAHTHSAGAASAPGTVTSPADQSWASGASPRYAGATDTTLASQAIQPAGGSVPHDNEPPYLVLNFCMALQGDFPPRD